MPDSPIRRPAGRGLAAVGSAVPLFLLSLVLLAAAPGTAAADQPETAESPPTLGLVSPSAKPLGDPTGSEAAKVEGLPDIGYWMLDSKGEVANWLGIRATGKRVAEPINVIIVDRFSPDAQSAIFMLEKALRENGFPGRGGHSKGYAALIGGARCPELLVGSKATYSDASFLSENDHGRIFGPFDTGKGFVFVAAFSRERPDTFRMRHVLVSFNVARDIVAGALKASGSYQIEGFVPLGNALFWSPTRTTWDHDGNAVLIEAESTRAEIAPSMPSTPLVPEPSAAPEDSATSAIPVLSAASAALAPSAPAAAEVPSAKD
ncbi:MAG TPA: hypothetical protein VMV83_11430 [Rectinemataceae bacterium]|nr:hypothetical protein [Rectinemataceae bacterium]